MQQNPIHDALHLPQMTPIQCIALRMRMWGRDVQFSCRASLIKFDLRFLDCRETRWQIYTHMQDENNPAFPPTELVNITFGRSEHRSPAHLLTEHFGLSLVYGELQLLHEDEIINLNGE